MPPVDYSAMTPEERAKARLQLYQQGVGLDVLRKTLPEGQGVGEFYQRELSPEQSVLDVEIARRQQELNLQREAAGAAEQRAIEEARSREARAAVAAALGESVEGEAAASSTATAPTPSFSEAFPEHVEPTQEQQYRNVITSRPGGPGEGRIVYETRRVPIGPGGAEQAADLAAAQYAGAEDWKTRALAENPMRAARTEALRGTPVSDTSPGFLVREGQGSFSPGRQIDQVLGERGITELTEAEIRRESPAMQDLLREAQQNEFQRQMQAGAVEDIGIRRRLGLAEAGMREEELADIQDPERAARRGMAMYNVTRELLGAERADAVETKVSAGVAAMKQMGIYSPQLEQKLRNDAIMELTGDPAVVARIDAIMAADPRHRQAQLSGGYR